MSYRREIFDGYFDRHDQWRYRGFYDDAKPSRSAAPVVSPEIESLSALIDSDPITAFTQMAKQVNLLPKPMFINTAPVDLSLGGVKAGEALGSFALKLKVDSNSLADLVDFEGDVAHAVEVSKGIKKGLFDAQVRVVYYRSAMPLGIELSFESFDTLKTRPQNKKSHQEAGSSPMSRDLLASLFTMMQPNDPNPKPTPPRHDEDYVYEPYRSEEYLPRESASTVSLSSPATFVEPRQPVSSSRPTQPSETAKKRWEKKQQKAQPTSQANKKDKAMEKRKRRAEKKTAASIENLTS